MTPKETLELIQQLKEMGADSIEVNGVKVNFTKVDTKITTKTSENDLTAEELVAKPNKYDELTDDEILYWSSGYGQELEAERKKEQEDNLTRKQEDAAR